MPLTDIDTARWEEIRGVIADAFEVEPQDIDADSHLQDDLGADSLTGIELLSALERRFDIVLPHESLSRMTTLTQIYWVVTDAIGNR